MVDSDFRPCTDFVCVFIRNPAGNFVRHLLTGQRADVQVEAAGDLAYHRGLVEHLGCQLCHCDGIEVAVEDVQDIRCVEPYMSVFKGYCGGVEADRTHSNGSGIQEKDGKEENQQADGHRQEHKELRASGLQPLVSIRDEGYQLLLLLLWDLPIALAGRTSHKAGTSSLFIRHTGVCWLAATSAEVVGSLAGHGWVIR